MEPRRGPLTAGEKVQFTDRKGKKITDQLVAGGSTQTEHGLILHDDVIGKTEGTVILTVHAKREAQVNQVYPEKDKNKPWKSSRAIGGCARDWPIMCFRCRAARRSCIRRTSPKLFSSATSAPACACLSPVPARAR